MAWSLILPKKQDNRKNSEVEVDGVGQNFKKGGRQHRRGLHKIGGLAPLSELCKETLKIPHLLHYKTTNAPHYIHFWKISSRRGEGGGVQAVLSNILKVLIIHQSKEIPGFNKWKPQNLVWNDHHTETSLIIAIRGSLVECYSRFFSFIKYSSAKLLPPSPSRKTKLSVSNIYLIKVNNRNTRKRYEICWK